MNLKEKSKQLSHDCGFVYHAVQDLTNHLHDSREASVSWEDSVLICVSLGVFLSVNVYELCLFMFMYTCIFMFVPVYVCSICLYVYQYTYMYICIHIQQAFCMSCAFLCPCRCLCANMIMTRCVCRAHPYVS